MPLPAINLIGNLTADPELRYTNSGKSVANFRVACSERRKDDAGNWTDGDTTYIDVVAWGRGEAIRDSLSKGTQVVITGTLKQRAYETKDGEKRNTYEINATHVALVIKEQVHVADNGDTMVADPWAGAIGSDETPF